MEFEITGRHVEVTQGVKDYLAERRDKLTGFFDRIHSLKVIISQDGANTIVEFIAHLIKGDMIVSRGAAVDLFAAIDEASDKMEAQLRKYKDKLREHRLKGEEPVGLPPEVPEEEQG